MPDWKVVGFKGAALTMCQLGLVVFAWWGIQTLVAEIRAADPAYRLLVYAVYLIGLAIVLQALSLWVRLWTSASPPGLVPFVALAAIPVLMALTIVLLRPNHTYTQRPFHSLIDMVGR